MEEEEEAGTSAEVTYIYPRKAIPVYLHIMVNNIHIRAVTNNTESVVKMLKEIL